MTEFVKDKAWAILGLIFFLLLLLLPHFYFTQRFNLGTRVAGIPISGLTVQEAEETIQTALNERRITIQEDGEAVDAFPYPDFFQIERIKETLVQTLDIQGFWLRGSKVQLKDDQIVLQEPMVEAWVDRVNSERIVPKDAQISRQDDGRFVIQPEELGNTIDHERFVAHLLTQRESQALVIELLDVYEVPGVFQGDPGLVEAVTLGNRLREQEFVLDLPEEIKVEVSNDLVNDWLGYSYEDGQFVVDTDQISDWLVEVNDEHMAYMKPVPFDSTYQGQIEVPAGSLGWAINREETAHLIAQGLLDDELHNKRLVEAVIDGLNYDLNPNTGSYIEVDLNHQTMIVVIDGRIELETPIVSGMSQGQPPTPTIPGAYQIWNKESPSVLVGVNQQMGNDYEQPVEYWLPFDDVGQGIHDANWQGAFGGSVYVQSGSQGCINTSPEDMPLVYDLAYVGMPVLVFGF